MEYLKVIEGFDRTGGGMGMLRAIERGYVQREIQNAAYGYQREVDASEAVVVGVNRFADAGGEEAVPVQRMDEDLERRQVERVRGLRARRDVGRCESALAGVKDAARGGENVMPRILEAVEASATVGEVADVLRGVFGEYRESVVV